MSKGLKKRTATRMIRNAAKKIGRQGYDDFMDQAFDILKGRIMFWECMTAILLALYISSGIIVLYTLK